MLREHPLFARATPAQLLALIGVAREVPLSAGAVVADLETPPAVYQVIEGELLLESRSEAPLVATTGSPLGGETLAVVARAACDRRRPGAGIVSIGALFAPSATTSISGRNLHRGGPATRGPEEATERAERGPIRGRRAGSCSNIAGKVAAEVRTIAITATFAVLPCAR